MNRENNNYINLISGEILNATDMNEFVKAEAKRQWEDHNGGKFEDNDVDYQMDCILHQWEHQLSGDWDKTEDWENDIIMEVLT
jgi:hypothetical protein